MTQDQDFKRLVRDRMRATGALYTQARATLIAERAAADRLQTETLRRFFDGDRLRTIPARRKARMVVLLELVSRFHPDRAYREAEISAILREVHEDFAYLRRELVNYGYLTRQDGIYRVAETPPARKGMLLNELPADEAARFRAARAAGRAAARAEQDPCPGRPVESREGSSPAEEEYHR